MEQKDTELHEAVRYGDTNLVESALKDGLDPNAIGLYQWSPMHEAASNGDVDILKLLLKSKGDPNAGDNLHGCTATHYAAKEGHADCLQLLVDYGGRYDTANNDGETPMDMAEGKCREILEMQCTGDYIEQTLRHTRPSFNHHGNIADPHSNEEKSQHDRFPERTDKDTPHRPSTGTQPVSSTTHGSDIPDRFSPPPRTSTPKAWDHIEVLESSDRIEAGTGLLQLSFEYNSRTSILKIRIWQVEDLLLPPVEFANIGRIYVKSRLLPDKKGESKRRTEEHRLDDHDKMKNSLVTLKRKKARDSFKAIFLPCIFKFSKPLEYKKITKEIVASSTVHIDVCVKQKYSTKSFVIANIQLPLKKAVRKLRKEKLQLHPCINYTMPDNVHVYDPKDLVIVTEGMYSNTIVSQPNLRAISKQNMREEKQRRTNSDINLKAIRTQSVESIPSIVVDVPEEADDTNDILQEIAVMDDSKGPRGLSRSEPQMTVVQMGEASLPGSTDDELEEVRVIKPRRKISRSSPDITVINVGESETSFGGLKSSRLKLNRPLSPPKKEDGKDIEVKVETIPSASKGVRSKFKEQLTRQAAEDLQTVIVETPKKTFQRKSKEQVAVIELEDLEEQSSRNARPRPRLHRPTSPPNKLSIPEIRVVDAGSSSEHNSVVSIDTDQIPKHRHLYQKKQETPKPGRVVDLRLRKDQKGSGEMDKHVTKVSSSHTEESSIGHRSTSPSNTKPNYTEITELTSTSPRSTSSKMTSPDGYNADVTIVGEAIHHRAAGKPHQLTKNTSKREGVDKSRHLRQEAIISPTSAALRKQQTTSHGHHERIQSPNSLTKETTAMIRQQDFPQTLTRGMMHTELNPLLHFSVEADHKNNHVNHSSNRDDTQMHYVSETQEKSHNKSKHKSPVRKKEPVIKRPSQKVSSPDAEIEMTELILDPAQLATPEFKLKAFQRTAKDPHPSTPFLHKTKSKQGLNDTQLEKMDPFFVPGTPLQSPLSPSGSPLRVVSPANARTPVRDRSPPDGPRVRSSGTGQSGLPGVESPTEIGLKSKVRSRGRDGLHRVVAATNEGGENNNKSKGKGNFEPIPNPVVTKLKQSWL